MADFDELNKIKVKEIQVDNGESGVMIGAEKVNTYKFLENEDIATNKSWTVDNLYSEFKSINGAEEDQTIDDQKARELEKKNSKFSDKDRKKSVARSKEIRKRKMSQVDFENMMGHNILKSGEKLKLEKKYIELDAEAREEYIKAYMVDDDKYAIDISMNKMRKYYRLIRMYIDHSRDKGISERTRNSYANEISKLRTKLEKQMKDIRKYKGYGKYFSWEKVTGHQIREKRTAQQNINRDDAIAGRAVAKAEAERQKRLNRIEARKQLVETGKWTDENGEEHVLDEEWPLAEYSEYVNASIFTDKERADYPDDLFNSMVKSRNDSVKHNLKLLNDNSVNYMIKCIRSQVKDEYQERLASFVGSGVPWVKKYCTDLLKNFFTTTVLDSYFVDDIISDKTRIMTLKQEMLKPLAKASRRWAILKKADFHARGIDISKSKAILKILGPDEETKDLGIKEKDLVSMVKRAQGTDRLLRRMVVDKFGKFSADEIYADLRKFIGDKALFASNRVIKDYAERYLNGLAITNRNVAQKQLAYEDAYKNKISGPFSEVMRSGIEKYLLATSHDWNEAGKYREKMENKLEIVVDFLAGMEKFADGKSLSEKGWKEFFKLCSQFVENQIKRFARDPKNDVANFAIMLERRTKEIFDKDEGQEKISCYEYCGKRKKAAKESEVDTLTFGDMIKKTFDSKLFSDVIPYDDVRKFLADNLNVILFRNPGLREKFPFLKDIKGIDGLDDLGFDQVEGMMDYLYKSISEKGMDKEIRTVLESYKVSPEVHKRALLEIMRSGTKKADVKKVFIEEYSKLNERNKLVRKKLLVTIGTDKEMRDGKIRYRYEDMPDREKTLAQSFIGWDKDWMRKRAAHANRATEVWRKLEKIGPEAVAQVRQWLKNAIDSDNPDGKLMELAQALQGDKKKFKVFTVKVKGNANVVTDEKLAA